MKKIILSLLLVLTLFSNSFAATVTNGDSETIDTSDCGGYASAASLSSTKAVVAFQGNGDYVDAAICTVSGSNITAVGTIKRNISGSQAATNIKTIKLTNSLFVVTYITGGYAYATACSVSDTTITSGTTAGYLGSGYLTTNSQDSIRLTDSSFVVILNGQDNKVDAQICTVSGTTITKGTTKANISSNVQGGDYRAGLLEANKFVVTYKDNSDGYCDAVICSVTDTTTITAATPKSNINNSVNYTRGSLVILNSGLFVFSFSRTTDYYGNAVACTVSGTTIINGSNYGYTLSNNTAVNSAGIVRRNDSSFVYVFGASDANQYLHGRVCTVSETTITADETNTTMYQGKTWGDLFLNPTELQTGYFFLSLGISAAKYPGAVTFTAIPTFSKKINGVSTPTKINGCTTMKVNGI